MAVVINGTTGIDTVQPLNQTVTATGKLGIGVTSPTGKVHIKNDSAVATNAQTAYDNASLRLDNLNTGSSVGLSFGLLGANTNYIQGGYNEGTVAPIALNPYGGGVAIGGTAAANTMDEYEEGTATVDMSAGTSGSITLASAAQTVLYTKIGRQVTITGNIGVESVSSPVGILKITGLPFTNGGALSNAAGVALYSDLLLSGAITMMEGFIYLGHNYITVRAYAAGATNGNSANLVKAGTTFRISATYFV